MVDQTLKIFKLHYSGEIKVFDEKCEDLLDLFSSLNIISFYIGSEKKLYTWVGSHVSRTLKNYISVFREIFYRDYPEYRVLRYITVESNVEPSEFFELVGIDKKQLEEYIKNHEEKLTPVLSKIEKLKNKEDELFESEKFDDAIKVAKDIKKLAKKIDDPLLESDQDDFIIGAEYKAQIKHIITEINREAEIIKNKIEKIETNKDIIELHIYIVDFKDKFDRYLTLKEASVVNQLLKHEEEIWNNFSIKLKEIERLEEYKKQIAAALEEKNLKVSLEILNKSKEIVQGLQDEEITKTWKEIEEQYSKRESEFSDQLTKLEQKLEDHQKAEQYEAAIQDCEDIIQLGKTYTKDDLIKNYEDKIEQIEHKTNEIEEQIKKRESEFSDQLTKLEQKLEEDQKAEQYEAAIQDCENIIQLGKTYTKDNLVKNYEDKIEQIKHKTNEIEEQIKKRESEFSDQLTKLEQKLEDHQKAEQYEAAIPDCEDIIQLGKTYTKDELVKNYLEKIEKIKEKITKSEELKQKEEQAKKKDEELKIQELNKLKELIKDLSKKALETLFEGYIIKSKGIYDEIISKITAFQKR